MNSSTQLKAHIRNLAKAKNVEAEIILRNYMLERFLERISLSKYKDCFILKGGMLITALVGIDTRTTMDMDATVKNRALTESIISELVTDILNIEINDGVLFTLREVEEIREDATYPSYRASLVAAFDKTRQIIKIDMTAGDSITPKEIEFNYRLMFEDRTINIMAYNLETVLAEKYETIITRGVTTSRMRDYYDIYILTTTQSFDYDVFRTALQKTVNSRGTTQQMEDANNIIQTVAKSSILIDLWYRYQQKYNYAGDVTWEMAIEALKKLCI